MKKKLLFIIFFLAVFDAWAQKKPEINSYVDSTINSIISQSFKFKGIYQTIEDSLFEVGTRRRISFYAFGFYGCPPCRSQLPYLIRMADSMKFCDVIYITYDDKKTLYKELDELGINILNIPHNMFFINTDLSKIRSYVVGYPTHYITDTNNKVLYTDLYDKWPGEPHTLDPVQKIAFWKQIIESYK